MGMGYAPTHGWVLTTAELKKIVPDEVAALEAVVELHKEDGEEVFAGIGGYAQYEANTGQSIQAIADAVEVVVNAFKAKTKVGNSELSLWLCYYDEESGDRYDEMEDGEYWEVGGMEVLSPAGEALRKVVDIDDKCWTHFG